MTPADVQGIGEQTFVIGADVDLDRQAVGGMEPGGGDVEADLADGNAHAVAAEVAQSENALAIGDHDQGDVGEGGVAEDVIDAVDVVGGDIEAAATAEEVAELLAGFANSRGVHYRQHFFEMIENEGVAEGLIPVEQGEHKDVLFEFIRLGAKAFIGLLFLQRERGYRLGQQAAEAQALALILGKSGSLVIDGVFGEEFSLERDFYVLFAAEPVGSLLIGQHSLSLRYG
ncbi:MAG: hypothetical protein BWY77_01833 [bacterium ADurb.Bin431]|nr:MAG: hypothetical protein BWY77_01833 [bacterium ADurb.Bin431]